MKPLELVLEKIRYSITQYETCKLSFTADQSEILRDLSTCLFNLSEHRIYYHEQWMKEYMAHKGSNASKERFADSQVPELYQIRHIMSAGQKVLESIRSTISANKNG